MPDRSDVSLRPMLASVVDVRLDDRRFAYEPKYDGMRTIAYLARGERPGGVRLISRLGNNKTAQFPEIVRTLQTLSRRLKASVVLDGEIVALDERGEPAGFQRLQGRIHLTRARAMAGHERAVPVAFVVFDVLRDGDKDLRRLPLVARRARLERIVGNHRDRCLRLSEFVPGDARALSRRAAVHGWEGLVAKRLDSPYVSGRRSRDWRKLKLVRQLDCVIGGWTQGRGRRSHFGALVLGIWHGNRLDYIGHAGTGLSERERARLVALLTSRETDRCPFRVTPRTNERAHWARPDLVVTIQFSEWTADGKLRQPQYLGLRDGPADAAIHRPVYDHPRPIAASTAGLPRTLQRIYDRLIEIEAGTGDGPVPLGGGVEVVVSNLNKVFWPGAGITKGELMRYYVAVSSLLLPAVADRPLVMRRLPDGIGGKAFYQQHAPASVPAGVRVEALSVDAEVPRRLIGGSLATLLFMVQVAAISQDAWFSRIGSLDEADHVAFDLDPMPGVGFTTVLDVARWIHDELERLGTPSHPKTSGAEGLHIYVPLPPGTSYETGRLFCEIVATVVAKRHPRVATIERSVNARGHTVYIDYLQNIRGKTLATAYSARASEWAGVSTPLTWRQVHEGIDRHDFTVRTVLPRVAQVGDLWRPLRDSRGADLRAVLRRARDGRR